MTTEARHDTLTMTITPQNQRILIVPLDDTIDEVIITNATQQIKIPDEAQPHYALVIAVAPDCKLQIKPGDKVILPQTTNICIVDFHKGYGLLHETNVLATFVEDKKPDIQLVKS